MMSSQINHSDGGLQVHTLRVVPGLPRRDGDSIRLGNIDSNERSAA